MTEPTPPFNPLYVFAVAARLGNLTRASEELGVSQSAVSRQIAVLEAYLGAPLFQRERHGIALTSQGDVLHREVGPAFDCIVTAAGRLRHCVRAAPLRLRVYSTFAAKWLLPRLHRFEAAHPGIGVRLNHTVAPVDFRRDPVDLAIQLGDGRWAGLEARHMMPDILQPVCSPSLLGKGPPPRRPDDLRRYRMLISHYRRNDWRDWLAGIGRSKLLQDGLDLALQDGLEFTSSVLTYQAAIEGLGVAIGQMPLLEADLSAGLLVPLFKPVERPLGYHVVWPAGRPLDRRCRAFLAWLHEERATSQASRPTVAAGTTPHQARVAGLHAIR